MTGTAFTILAMFPTFLGPDHISKGHLKVETDSISSDNFLNGAADQSFRLSLFYGAAAVKDIYGTDIRKWSKTGDLPNLTPNSFEFNLNKSACSTVLSKERKGCFPI